MVQPPYRCEAKSRGQEQREPPNCWKQQLSNATTSRQLDSSSRHSQDSHAAAHAVMAKALETSEWLSTDDV